MPSSISPFAHCVTSFAASHRGFQSCFPNSTSWPSYSCYLNSAMVELHELANLTTSYVVEPRDSLTLQHRKARVETSPYLIFPIRFVALFGDWYGPHEPPRPQGALETAGLLPRRPAVYSLPLPEPAGSTYLPELIINRLAGVDHRSGANQDLCLALLRIHDHMPIRKVAPPRITRPIARPKRTAEPETVIRVHPRFDVRIGVCIPE